MQTRLTPITSAAPAQTSEKICFPPAISAGERRSRPVCIIVMPQMRLINVAMPLRVSPSQGVRRGRG